MGVSVPLSELDAQALDAALVAAPFIVDGWQRALALLARAGGAIGGELAGLNPREGLVFSVVSGWTPEAMTELARAGGYVSEVNPRIDAVMGATPYAMQSEPDFISEKSRSRSALYEEVLKPYEADLSCVARLGLLGDTQPIMCVLKSSRKGHYEAAEREVLALAMPKLEAAIRLHMAVEQRGAQLAGQAFDTLGAAAFLFDRIGRVISLSQAAADMVRRQDFLRLKHGVLTATDAASNTGLQQAIHRCCRAAAILDASAPVILRGPGGVVVADVAPLPPDGPSFGGGAAAILLVPHSMAREKARAVLAAAFGLTAAEADIAARLSEGSDVQAIAGQRGASVQTVRGQIKTILSKTGARTQAQLVAIIAGITRP